MRFRTVWTLLLTFGLVPLTSCAKATLGNPDRLSVYQVSGLYWNSQETLEITANGRFNWMRKTYSADSDIITPARVSGIVENFENSLNLVFDPTSFKSNDRSKTPDKRSTDWPKNTPLKLTPLQILGKTYLMKDADFVDIVNMHNGSRSGSINSSVLLRRKDAHELEQVPNEIWATSVLTPLLPGKYQSLILLEPVDGRIIEIGPVHQDKISVIDELHKSKEGVQYSAEATVDLGATNGAFVGMGLYVGLPKSYAVVGRVLDRQSKFTLMWYLNPPMVGDSVSSSRDAAKPHRRP